MSALRREIGPIGAGVIALNGIVGAGIFAMPEALVKGAGAASPYLVLLFGALMLFVALVFAELAAHFDKTGGPVPYVAAAFGPLGGFAAGWLYYVTRCATLGANLNAFLTYGATFLPGADKGALRAGLMIAVVAVLTIINIRGVKGAVRALNALTLLKLAPLIALVAWGLYAFAQSVPAPQVPGAGSVGEIGLVLLYAFIGFEMATLTGGETSDAKRSLPRVLVGTVAAMAVFYFLVQLAYVAIMQGRAPEGAPLTSAAQVLAGPWAAGAVAVAAMLSIGGNLFAASIVTPRITFALAEERGLPRWFAAVHGRWSTPVNSILVLAFVVAALAVSSAFVWLAIMASLARMLVYLGCTAALLKLRRGWGARPRKLLRLLLYYAAPAVAAGLCLWAVAQAKMDAWLFLGLFSAIGVALFLVQRVTARAAGG